MIEDVYEDISYEDLRAQRDVLQSLLDSAGWRLVVEFLEERANTRERMLSKTRPKTMEQLIEYNSIAAAIDELRLVPQMIGQIYSDTETQIKYLQEEMAYASGEADEPGDDTDA